MTLAANIKVCYWQWRRRTFRFSFVLMWKLAFKKALETTLKKTHLVVLLTLLIDLEVIAPQIWHKFQKERGKASYFPSISALFPCRYCQTYSPLWYYERPEGYWGCWRCFSVWNLCVQLRKRSPIQVDIACDIRTLRYGQEVVIVFQSQFRLMNFTVKLLVMSVSTFEALQSRLPARLFSLKPVC